MWHLTAGVGCIHKFQMDERLVCRNVYNVKRLVIYSMLGLRIVHERSAGDPV